MKCKLPVFVIMALATAPAVWGHHSLAGYDMDKTMTFSGVVKKFAWTNPHAFIYLVVQDDKGGEPTVWALECGQPSVNIRMGWRPNDLKSGDKATVEFRPARDGTLNGISSVVFLPNGNKRYCPGYSEKVLEPGPGGPG
jgi:hypothetical protein